MTKFELRVLGGAAMHRADGSLVTGRAVHRHRLALMALLARSAPGGVSRDKLVGLLWPEREEAAARHLLRAALHDLRQTLGADALHSSGNEVRIDPELVAVDAAQFERLLAAGDLEAAVAIYRGPLLDGFFLERSESFDEWASAERQRLNGKFERALSELAEIAQNADDNAMALRWWRQLATLKPEDGRVALRLVETSTALGDNAGALAHAITHARWLKREMGVGPDPALIAAVQRVRAVLGNASPDWLAEQPAPAVIAPDEPPSRSADAPSDAAARPTVPPESAELGHSAPPTADDVPERIDAPAPASGMSAAVFVERRAPSSISASASRPVSPPSPRRRWLLPVAAAAVLAIAAAVPWRQRLAVGAERARAERSGIATSTTVVAVAPFDVVGGAPAELAEGIATLLTANLDQVAELRMVPSSTLASKQRTSGTIADPAELLRELRAELMLTGVVAQAPGGISITARLVDATGSVRARVELRGSPDDLPELVDRVSIELLRALWGRQWGIPQPRLAAVSTGSTAALRAFLRGEAFIRAALWDSAAGALAEAVDLDSTFALAHLRLAEPYGWRYGMASAPSQRALAAASRFANRLPPRERMLLAVRRLHEEGAMSALDSAAALAERYPDDAEAQYVSADVRYHAMEALGRTMAERAVAAFDTAALLDSTSARVFAHPVTLALAFGDSARFGRMTRRLVALNGGSHVQVAERWDYALLARTRFSDPADGIRELATRLQTAAPPVWQLSDLISSAERAVVESKSPQPMLVDSVHRLVSRAYPGDIGASNEVTVRRALWRAGTGRMTEARASVDAMWEADPNPAPAIMLMPVMLGYAPPGWLDGIPERLASTQYWQESPDRRRRAMYWRGILAVVKGSTAEAREAFRAAADPAAFRGADGASDTIGHGLAGALRAADAWARVRAGESGAMREVEAGLREVGYEGDGLLLARPIRVWWTLQLARNSERRAESIDRIRGELLRGEGFRWAWWWLELSRALAAQGDAPGAAAARRRFDALWAKADVAPGAVARAND